MRAFAAVAVLIGAGLILSFFFVVSTSAQDKFKSESKRVQDAAAFLETLAADSDAAPFRLLLGRARAVAVFPVVQEEVGLFLESTHGDGLLSIRNVDGWTVPAFYLIGSYRYRRGWVAGGRYAVVLLFMDSGTLPVCGKENIGLDPKRNTQAGPLSETQAAELKDPSIIAYAFVKGKLMPVPPKRKDWTEFTLNDQDKLNKRIYGIKTCEIFAGAKPKQTAVNVTAFGDVLKRNWSEIAKPQ